MWDFLKRHPFATYGILALVLFAIIRALNLQYDDGNIGTILILSSAIWGFVYWAPQEFLFAINNGNSFEGQIVISVVFGFSICALADYLLAKRRKRLAKESKPTAT